MTSACILNLSVITACITNVSVSNGCITNISCLNISCMGNMFALNGYFTNNVYAGYSDDRLKIRHVNLSDCLSKINSLSTFQYYPNVCVCESLQIHSCSQLQIGMSAQEVKNYFPELVNIAPCDILIDETTGKVNSRSGLNILSIQYEKFTPVIIQAIHELTERIRQLELFVGIS